MYHAKHSPTLCDEKNNINSENIVHIIYFVRLASIKWQHYDNHNETSIKMYIIVTQTLSYPRISF